MSDPSPRLNVTALRFSLRQARQRRRWVTIGAGSVILAAFGSMMAYAGDDTGVYAFIRSQSQPAKTRSAAPLHAVFVPSANRRALGYAPAALERPQAFRYTQGDLRTGQAQSGEFASLSPLTRTTEVGRSRVARHGLPRATKYCVRLCDGFFFPLSLAESESGYGQATCSSLCPAAETQLFSAPQGSDGIELASAQGVSYSSLPRAYAYRKQVSRSCTCTSSGIGLNVPPIGQDHTLKKGDLIATVKGARRFSGTTPSLRRLSSTWTLEASVRSKVSANIDRLIGTLQTGAATRLEQADRLPRTSAKVMDIPAFKPGFERIGTQSVAELGQRGGFRALEPSVSGWGAPVSLR
ncbi:MAG: DUF2865 domain-containing protein [Beijerinckiaceae bacterium]|nr:DUF2865 domain-containing protein [Beijerinckiaceae bacterium]